MGGSPERQANTLGSYSAAGGTRVKKGKEVKDADFLLSQVEEVIRTMPTGRLKEDNDEVLHWRGRLNATIEKWDLFKRADLQHALKLIDSSNIQQNVAGKK